MGRDSMKASDNQYFQARKKAAEYNEALYSREGAAEKLGVSVSTLADYELGNTKVVPVDKVVLMADLYNAPELITKYCRYECPIHGYMPLATEEKNLQGIALRLLKGLGDEDIRKLKNDVVEILEDGQISENEVGDFNNVIEKLDSLVEVISELKLASEKILKSR